MLKVNWVGILKVLYISTIKSDILRVTSYSNTQAKYQNDYNKMNTRKVNAREHIQVARDSTKIAQWKLLRDNKKLSLFKLQK